MLKTALFIVACVLFTGMASTVAQGAEAPSIADLEKWHTYKMLEVAKTALAEKRPDDAVFMYHLSNVRFIIDLKLYPPMSRAFASQTSYAKQCSASWRF